MDAQNKKLLYLSCLILISLGGLFYLKYNYFGAGQGVSFKVVSTSDQRNDYVYTADTSLYHFTSHEGKFPASTTMFSKEFIPNFPKKIGDWVGEDYENQYADIALFRLYVHKKSGDRLWLIIVSGGHESQFHSAEVCYIIDGWKIRNRDIRNVRMKNEVFPVRYLVAEKDNYVHFINYWYVFNKSRRNISDGVLLFRVSLEQKGSDASANRAFKDFLSGLSNLVMEVPEPREEIVQIAEVSSKKAKGHLPPIALEAADADLVRAGQQALTWIKSQRVPNTIVPYPHIDRRYLYLSYELNSKNPVTDSDRAYDYIYSRSAVYDDALVLIAHAMNRNYKEAELLIDAFDRLIRKDGMLWFSVNTHNNWPSKWDNSEAIIRNGASAWVGYAITYYLRRRLIDDPNILNRKSKFRHYLSLIKRIADAILRDQIADLKDPRNGAVTGGLGSFVMARDQKTDKVIEKFKEGKIKWASVEHNLDLYFFLKNAAMLTRKEKYRVAAKQVRRALLRAWNKEQGQFNRGLRLDGMDRAMALDCASWGLMFALSIGDKDKVKQLKKAIKKYAVVDGMNKVRGYRPYYKGLIYDELKINKVFYPHKPDKSWSDVHMVWSEGSLGVAMAYLKAGMKEEATAILKNMRAMQTKGGGLRYTTQEIPFQFSPSPSMAGTAWYAMVMRAMNDPTALSLFWD